MSYSTHAQSAHRNKDHKTTHKTPIQRVNLIQDGSLVSSLAPEGSQPFPHKQISTAPKWQRKGELDNMLTT
jgi:hypothetical protein